MARHREEFYCGTGSGGCGKYFQADLRVEEFGNVVIECPNCKQQHQRTMINGIAVADRFDKSLPDPLVVVGLAFTVSDVPLPCSAKYRRS